MKSDKQIESNQEKLRNWFLKKLWWLFVEEGVIDKNLVFFLLVFCGRQEELAILNCSCYYTCIASMYPALVWTSAKNEWNPQNTIRSRAFRPSTPRNMIMRVLTICQKLTQLIALEQMHLDRRLLTPARCNLWLPLVLFCLISLVDKVDCHCRVIEIEKLTFRFGLSRPREEGAPNKNLGTLASQFPLRWPIYLINSNYKTKFLQ